MQGRTLTILPLLLIALVFSAPAQRAHAQPEARPELVQRDAIPTRQSSFDVPFTIDDPGGSLVKVQLYVSVDRGRSWRLYAARPPAAGRFPFQAPRDGEYWFAVKTVGADQQPQPPGPPRVDLKVRVDTTPSQPVAAQRRPLTNSVTMWPADRATTQLPEMQLPATLPRRGPQPMELANPDPSERQRSNVPDRFAQNVSTVRSTLRGERNIDRVMPHGEQALWSRSRRFNLQYSLESVGPEEVASVDFWVTRDGGRSWNRWARDTDRKSPHAVEVPEDGLYGFRVVVASVDGLTGKKPQPGDKADIWARVDTIGPTARIVSAPFGRGSHAGALTINWEAEDLNLAPRPVTLLYAEHLEGPWRRIAGDLPNTRQFHWRADAKTPRNVYLRIEVRDQAGNVQVDQLSRPINLDAMIPSGRIQGLEPL